MLQPTTQPTAQPAPGSDGPALGGLYIYPIKSTAALALNAAVVEPAGLRDDRRWALADRDGVVITARRHPRLLAVRVSVDEAAQTLTLSADGASPLTLPRIRPAAPGTDDLLSPLTIFDDSAAGVVAEARVNDWFSAWLGIDCRLLAQPQDGGGRELPADRGGRPGDRVSYADECPLLLISEASLADLNDRLAQPVPMTQFRPNLVVRGCEPYAEDGWRSVRIGDCLFDVSQQCGRCVLATVDPATHRRHPDQEPLRTLAGYHRDPDGLAAFGVHLVPRRCGGIALGDAVAVQASVHR